MVLTNFECWVHGSNVGGISADIDHQLRGRMGVGVGVGDDVAASRGVDLFNPQAVHQTIGPMAPSLTQSTAVSHMSSNGYYGYCLVNSPPEANNNNSAFNINNNTINTATDDANNSIIIHNNNNNNTTNNNNNSNNNNNNSNNNNNNNNNCNDNNISGGGNRMINRCKKRCYINDNVDGGDINGGDYNTAAHFGSNNGFAARNAIDIVSPTTIKRCRYDDLPARYFNDFFTMQSDGNCNLQSCIMETEDMQQPKEASPAAAHMQAVLQQKTYNSSLAHHQHSRTVPSQQP